MQLVMLLAGIARCMHGAGINHRDFYLCHFHLARESLARGPLRCHLIDLHRAERFPIVPPWRKRYAPSVRFNREHWFVLELPSRQTIRLQRSEHRQYRWVDAGQAARRASSWTNRKLIRAWFETRHGGAARLRTLRSPSETR